MSQYFSAAARVIRSWKLHVTMHTASLCRLTPRPARRYGMVAAGQPEQLVDAARIVDPLTSLIVVNILRLGIFMFLI